MRIGISITKEVSFRGVQQDFSNVYHYELLGAVTGPWASMLAELVATEKGLHSVDVTFLKGRVWSAGGTAAENEMLYQEALTGTGTNTVSTSMDRERALLVQWPAGLNSLGKPVYLRKWYHLCGTILGSAPSTAQLQQTAELTSAVRTSVANHCAAFNEIGATEVWQLCAATGRRWAGQPTCHKWLEHHQLGDQWRAS